MNYFKTLLMVGVVAFGVQNAGAIVVSSGSLNALIPDDNGTGYESTLHIEEGLDVRNISVTLNITGGYAGDLYAYLTHDNYMAVLINRIGTDAYGNSSPGMNVTFTPDAETSIHGVPSGATQITGTYAPEGDLSVFANHASTGDWTLFIADRDGGGTATLESWSLEITEVPEPVNVALGVFGSGFVLLQGARFYKRKKSRESTGA